MRGDEIGDLSRSFGTVLARLAHYASYQEKMASRLSHELRTPIAVVRSSLENLRLQTLPDDARVYIERAQEGLERLAHILTRMTEATRLEQSLADAERERFDLAHGGRGLRRGLSRRLSRSTRFELTLPAGEIPSTARPNWSRRCSTSSSPTRWSSRRPARPSAWRSSGRRRRCVSRGQRGPPLPENMRGRCSNRWSRCGPSSRGDEPHLGLGLYIVRLIAEFHGGRATAMNRAEAQGVIVSVDLPLVRAMR